MKRCIIIVLVVHPTHLTKKYCCKMALYEQSARCSADSKRFHQKELFVSCHSLKCIASTDGVVRIDKNALPTIREYCLQWRNKFDVCHSLIQKIFDTNSGHKTIWQPSRLLLPPIPASLFCG